MPFLKEPAVTIERVTISALTLSALDLVVVLRVENPNLFGVTLRDLPFTVFCITGDKEQQIAAGNAGRITIRGSSSTALAVPVTAHNAGIVRATASLVGQGGVELEVRGTAVIDCLVTCRPVPFARSIRLTTDQITGALTRKLAGRDGNAKDPGNLSRGVEEHLR